MRQFAKGTRMRHDARSQPRAQGYQRHADKLDLCSVWCKTLQPVNEGDRRVWEWPLMVGVDP